MEAGAHRVEPAHAKINLHLRVLGRDSSGYHEVRTLLCALALADDIEANAHAGAAGVWLRVSGPAPCPPQENLARRAAEAFLREAAIEASIDLHLVKRIPTGAGLGGGSSDAAATLRAMDGLFPGAVAHDRLTDLAADLGSDVPFFLQPSPLAWAEGRGERVTSLPPLDARPAVLVVPPFPVATGEAYGWLDRDRAAGSEATASSTAGPGSAAEARRMAGDWTAVAGWGENDFEGPVLDRYPALRAPLAALARGAIHARMAGSGSTIFGVFVDEAAADTAADAVARIAPDMHMIRTRTRHTDG